MRHFGFCKIWENFGGKFPNLFCNSSHPGRANLASSSGASISNTTINEFK